MADKEDIKGIRGWLLFLVIALLAIDPLGCWYMIAHPQETYPNLAIVVLTDPPDEAGWQRYLAGAAWILGLAAALSVAAGLHLCLSRRRRAPRLANAVIWFNNLLVHVGHGLVLPALLFGVEFAGLELPRVMFNLTAGLAIATAWTLYLKRSRRVRNTYGPA